MSKCLHSDVVTRRQTTVSSVDTQGHVWIGLRMPIFIRARRSYFRSDELQRPHARQLASSGRKTPARASGGILPPPSDGEPVSTAHPACRTFVIGFTVEKKFTTETQRKERRGRSRPWNTSPSQHRSKSLLRASPCLTSTLRSVQSIPNRSPTPARRDLPLLCVLCASCGELFP